MKPVLLITGSTGGIGQATVNELKKDFEITAWYHKHEELALELKVKSVHQCDLFIGLQIKEVFYNTLKQHDTIDVLINCAGINFPSASFDEEQNVGENIDVNLRGPLLLTQLAYAQMKSQGYGTIINIASTAGVYN